MISDELRRQRLYEGHLFAYSPTPATLEFCELARSLVQGAFKGLEPQYAHYHMSVEEYAGILGRLKPAFIDHPRSKEFLQEILQEFGCDPVETLFDALRLRSSTRDGYLTRGIAYAWHPHRDTWYSAPQCQTNWWMPIYEIESINVMAFHSRYWTVPVQNTSGGYNYGE